MIDADHLDQGLLNTKNEISSRTQLNRRITITIVTLVK